MISKLIAAIETKANFGPISGWINRDYVNLSEWILEETHISISPSTLKRFFSGKFTSRPQKSTLDALAQFAGFKNWLNLSRDSNHEPGEVQLPKAKRMTVRFRPLIWWIAGGIVVITLLVLSFRFIHFGKSKPVLFTGEVVSDGHMPSTIIFHYDISMIEPDEAIIRFSSDPSIYDTIQKSDSIYISQYYLPGYFKPSISIGQKELATTEVFLPTNGWIALASYERGNPIPDYLDRDGLFEQGIMRVDPDHETKNHVNFSDPGIWVNYFKVQDFGALSGDHFRLETRIRNGLEDGAKTCQFAYIQVICENGNHLVPLCSVGCVASISAIFGDKRFIRMNYDLSAFGTDMDQWHDIALVVEGRRATVTLDGAEVMAISYVQPLERVKGIRLFFRGCGAVDYVRLFNSDQVKVLDDEF